MSAPSLLVPLKHLIPIIWLALLIALGARGVIADDARYAWGMFPYALKFEIDSRWVMDDGSAVAYVPSRRLLKQGRAYPPRTPLDAWYGLGALRNDLEAYGRATASSRKAPRRARAFEIELTWTKHEHDGPHVEVMRFPVTR